MILKRYIANEFLVSFVFSIIALAFVTIVSQFFDDLRMFIEHKTTINIILLYYIYKTPYIVVQITPVSVLLATLFSLSKLMKSNEITAMKSGGVNLNVIASPILISSLAVSLFIFIFSETLVPYCNVKVRETRQAKIQNIPVNYGVLRDNATFINSDGLVFFTKFFDGEHGTMSDVSIMEFDENKNMTHRWDAKESIYLGKGNGWQLKNGYKRQFFLNEPDENNMPKEKAEQFFNIFLPIKESPADLSKTLKKPEELSMRELTRYIKKLQRTGATFREELVNFYLRFSFPLANFILCLIGIPLALLTGRKGGLIASFAISLAIGFTYWGFIALGVALGKNGILPALLSAWIGNLIFGFLGIYLMNIVRKY